MLGLVQVKPLDHELVVVGAVVAGEPGGGGLVSTVLAVEIVELRALELQGVDAPLVVDVQPCPGIV